MRKTNANFFSVELIELLLFVALFVSLLIQLKIANTNNSDEILNRKFDKNCCFT